MLFLGTVVQILEIHLLFSMFPVTGMVSSSPAGSLVCVAVGTQGVQRLCQRWCGMA